MKQKMCHLFETEYSIPPNDTSLSTLSNNAVTSIQSLLDEDFEEDETSFDEIDCYIAEKPAIKETDVLMW
ncbi:10469_t:CDS:2 [Gigaspora margarita]|uniref:10469_t:CDS:1 n=1 Tax=Gigaspora margarita TaxID=4874 RepID=A0ABN7VW28_GIGMA|nr:10469_t:CDS:2 [Gigaspora margarita]